MKTLFVLFIGIFALSTVSVKESTLSLIVFEGSDWCSSCRKFEKNILNDVSVIKFLQEEGITITKIDFPQRKKLTKEQKKINRHYSERYQFEGVFPTIILSRTDTLLYHELQVPEMDPTQFIERLMKIQDEIR